jgi:hypothetical protein
MPPDIEIFHVFFACFQTFFVLFTDQYGFSLEASRGFCADRILVHRLIVDQRGALPVLAYFAEEAVFYRIPL